MTPGTWVRVRNGSMANGSHGLALLSLLLALTSCATMAQDHRTFAERHGVGVEIIATQGQSVEQQRADQAACAADVDRTHAIRAGGAIPFVGWLVMFDPEFWQTMPSYRACLETRGYTVKDVPIDRSHSAWENIPPR